MIICFPIPRTPKKKKEEESLVSKDVIYSPYPRIKMKRSALGYFLKDKFYSWTMIFGIKQISRHC